MLATLVVVGLALLAAAAWFASRPTSAGWFAYAPLSDTTFVPVGAYPPGLSALLAAAGALLVGIASGFVLGRRGRRATPAADGPGGAPSGDDASSGTV